MSYRRLWVLIKHLPPESWTQTKLLDSDLPDLAAEEPAERKFGPWSQADYLMANLIDAVKRNTYVTEVVGHIKDPQLPEPTPRPGLQRRARLQPQANVVYLNNLRAKG